MKLLADSATVIALSCFCLSVAAQDALESPGIQFEAELTPALPTENPAPELSGPRGQDPIPVQWIPRLRIELVTESNTTNTSFSGLEPLSTSKRQNIGNGQAVLRLDDVDLSVTANEQGELRYSFTTEGRFELEIGPTRVTGQSVTSTDGKLVATNATIRTSGGVSFSAEKLALDIPIIAVRINSNTPAAVPTGPPSFNSF